MSLKNTKNLIIIAIVAVALLAGTVLLGNYTNLLSTGSDTASQPKTCPATTCTATQAVQAVFASNTEGECIGKTYSTVCDTSVVQYRHFKEIRN